MLFYYHGDRMNNENVMYRFIKKINDNGLMTKFIMNIFNYNDINDNNYIIRIGGNDKEIIIDIYDNVSDTRFNRYIFNFYHGGNMRYYKDDYLYITNIYVLDVIDDDNKLLKLAYLFNIDSDKMVDYADSFLDNEFVELLCDIKKNKPI